MLNEQLKKLALSFVSIPDDYHLIVEDYSNEQAAFIWSTDDLEESIEVTLDSNGKLIDLTRPSASIGTLMTTQQQQALAEQFLTDQYPEAFDYITLSTIQENEEETKFIYKQYVGDYSLSSYYTKIIVTKYGEITEFNYNGYTKTPPKYPVQIANKERVLKQVYKAPWALSVKYLDRALYSVSQSGLYPIYESEIVYQSFNAVSAESSFQYEPEEPETFIPFPSVSKLEPQAAIEEIIGISDDMEKIREVDMDEHTLGIVWREKKWQAPKNKTMESFLLERMEDTVKAKVDKHSTKLKEFIWFKERTGEHDLSYEACRDIACAFIATYFEDYIPYLQLKVEEQSFNEVNRAFFHFPLNIAQGLQIDGEHFYVGVNKTTGFIDLLLSPSIELNELKSYRPATIQPFEDVMPALDKVDAYLQWSRKYDDNENAEVLEYKLGHLETKKRIIGIDATTGELIYSKL